MAKSNSIHVNMRIKGIRMRWMVNSMSVVALILLITMAILLLTLWSFYYGSMTENLTNQATQTAAEFNKYTRSDYSKAAQNAVSEFEDSNKLEMQFLDAGGSVLFTSYGITSGTIPDTPDVVAALTEQTVVPFTGEDPQTGERIMAVSAPVIYQGTSVVGAVRMVTSMTLVDQQIYIAIAVCALVALAIIMLVYFSNLYFVRSIVEPLASITETARLIADGSYGVQIEKTYDDEIGELTDTINDMSMKIKQSEKTQSEFISSVSHELRTPLTAITGWAETIQSGEMGESVDPQKGLDIIVSEAHRLTGMVEELLEFSRMEDGRFTLSVEPIDLKAELEDAVYTYREFFRREGISLEYTECPQEMVPMVGDPDRLRQVFCNILDNAAKHGGSGGRIDVTMTVKTEMAFIYVRDFGAGIPPKELPHVKYKFYKGSSKARGSGIGLAVCEEIVTRHEGNLVVDNAQGGGCVVTIALPLEQKF